MTLNEIQTEAHMTAVEKGWWEEERPFGEIVANLHDEISEAWRAYCHNEGKYKIGEELADCVIRILDYCKHVGIDLEHHLRLKMAYNKTRPYRHGGKRA